MNILIASSFFPPDKGGIETYAYNLAKGLIKRGHGIQVVCAQRTGKRRGFKIIDEYYDRIPVRRFEIGGVDFKHWPRDYSRRYSEVRVKEKYDLIIILNVSALTFAIERFPDTPKIYVIPTVFHYAAQYITKYVDPKMKITFDTIKKEIEEIEKKALDKIDLFVALSRNVKDQFVKRYNWTKYNVSVVPPHIDLAKFRRRKISKENLIPNSRGKKVVLVMSRVAQDKNIQDAINAFNLVKCKESMLVICGSEASEYKNMILRNMPSSLNDRVYFAGPVSKPWEYYNAADVLILPSRVEGFGLVLAEAQACGLPCIAFKRDGKETFTASEEIITDKRSGYVVSNIQEMSRRIDEIISDPRLRNKLALFAIKNAQNYSEEKCMNRFVLKMNDLV